MDVFVIRHEETAWSLGGQHTSTTDIPLTENGRRAAERLRSVLAKEKFALVLVSPMQRARETCNLAGLGVGAIVDPNLTEWNYGDCEGLTPALIQDRAPGWLLFKDGCPHGESLERVTEPADQVTARAHAAKENVALFAHGHILRVFAARRIGMPTSAGQHVLLDTGTLPMLGHCHNIPAIPIWNGPLV